MGAKADISLDGTTQVSIQQNGELYNVVTLGIASSDAPPLRIDANNSFFDPDEFDDPQEQQRLPILTSGDVCFGIDGQVSLPGTLHLRLRDRDPAFEDVQVRIFVGQTPTAQTCRDPAPPALIDQPLTVGPIDEGGTILIGGDQLLSVVEDPNGDPQQLLWGFYPSGVTPAAALDTPITREPLANDSTGFGLRFTPAADYSGPAQIRYSVADDDGSTDFFVDIFINETNDPPSAEPSLEPCTVTLSGSPPCVLNVSDPDADDTLTFNVIRGPANGTLSNFAFTGTSATVQYTPRSAQPDSFRYSVTDSAGATSAEVEVSVVVQSDVPPTALIRLLTPSGTPINNPSAIADTDGLVGEAVQLDGSASLQGSPPAAIVSYDWIVNGQALAEHTATVNFRLPDMQSTIELIVHDDAGRSSAPTSLQANVNVANNTGPTARIAINGQVRTGIVPVPNSDFEPGETVTFDGSQSSDPDEDEITLYVWTLNGTEVQNSASPTVSLDLPDGASTLTLTVTDARGSTGSVTITPTVDADPNLASLPGLTPGQRAVGGAISELCPRLAAIPGEERTSGQTELLDRCTDILNGTSSQQREALDALTPDEISTQQTTGIDFSTSQLANVGARLTALRAGASGFSAAGLSIRDENGRLIPIEQLAAFAKHLTGGASGDEEGESLAVKWGFFINGNIIDGDKDETANESGYEFGGWGITAGFDYRFTDNFVLGLSLGYNESETDFDDDGGSMDSEGTTTSIYGTYFNDRWYADFIGSSGSIDYESLRRIVYTDADGLNDDTALGSTDGDLSTLGVSFGYDFNKGGWTFGPTLALTNIEIDIDAFAETGVGQSGGMNLAFGEQSAKSRTAQGGFQFSYAVSREWGVLSPQMRVAFVKEFENESQVVNVRFVNDPFANDPSQPSPGAITIVTDDPDDEYVRWGVGLTFVRANGVSAFIDYEALAGFRTVKSSELTFGVRFARSFK